MHTTLSVDQSRLTVSRPKLTVWYNTKCPVCNGGIEWQRRRLVRAARAGAIEFRDINLEPNALARFGADIEDVRRRLHASIQMAACTLVLIALSRSGPARLGRRRWDGCSACRL